LLVPNRVERRIERLFRITREQGLDAKAIISITLTKGESWALLRKSPLEPSPATASACAVCRVSVSDNCKRSITVWFFIARQHTDARYWYSKSVCPSVCPWRSGSLSDENGKTYRHIVFSPYDSPILFLSAANIFTKLRWGHPLRGR